MKILIRLLFLPFFWLSTLPTFAQSLPELSDSAALVLNTEQEQMLGQQVMLNVRRKTPFSNDSLLLNYLDQLSRKLASHSPRSVGKIKSYLAIDSAINAFAVPGGYITLNTGLIENTNSEDELAAVIAHEIGHHSQRHISRSLERSKQLSVPAAAAIIGGILIGGQVGTAAVVSTQAMLGADQLTYSKIFEGEADATGMKILAAAGYATKAMPAFFGALEKQNRLLGGQLPAFLRTHPVSSDRIADSLSRAERLSSAPHPPPLSPLSYAYAKIRIQALYSEPVDHILNEFKTRIAKHQNNPTLAAEALYGQFIAYMRKKEYNKAKSSLARLVEIQPDHPLNQLNQADLALNSGDIQQAVNTYAQLYSAAPDNPVNVQGYARALLQIKDYPTVVRILRKTLRRAPTQIWAYELLAQAYGGQGKTLHALINQAQKLKLTGQYTQALDILKQQETSVHTDQSDYLLASIKDLTRQIEQARLRLDNFKL